MEKLERGRRNLEKFRTIASSRHARGQVTFWNPTQEQKRTTTIHSSDASLVTQLHGMINPKQQEQFLLKVATLSGFDKILEYAWSKATFKVRQ